MNQKIIAPTAEFGFNLLRAEAARKPKENVFISPLSVSLALGMTFNGARGKTQQEMAEVLGIDASDLAAANLGYANLLAELRGDLGVELAIANAIFAAQGVDFHEAFLAANSQHFGANIATRDFSSPATVAEINKFCDDNTKGKINKILDELTPDMIMILLNAVYFKGIWTTKFRKSMTDLLPFYTGEGEKLHPLMFRRDDIQYTQTETAQVVRLPFGQNERVSLYVLLPLKGMRQALGTGDVLATLNQLTLSGMRQRLFQEDVQLWLPRVESEYESTLNGSLAEMGMPSAFSGSADFSGMRPIPPVVKIDEVRHKTFFKMDEKGAEAAAVTSVSMTLECCIQRDEVVMRVDRPFVTLIVDDTTGTLLFAGVINNPEWKSADEGSDEDEEENTDESGDMDGSPALPGPDNPCLIDPDSIGGREESFEEGDEILE